MEGDTYVSDYLGFLTALGDTGASYFLKGGQAVNFWAEYFTAKGAGDAILHFRPFTSKDCDLWVSHAALRQIETSAMGGRFVKGNSPADGQIGIFTLDGPPPRRIDLLSHVYGIPVANVPKLLERAVKVNGIWVIDPILLFQSKCHCLLGLDQATRQDEKHLRILCLILPEHFSDALADALAGRASQRALINEIKILLDALKTQRIKRALKLIGVESASLVPWDLLRSCGLPKVERFAASIRSEA